MAKFKSRTFTNECLFNTADEYIACRFVDCMVRADGNSFAGCEFIGGILQHAGKAVGTFAGTHFRNTRYEFVDNAIIAVAQLHRLYHDLPGGKEVVDSLIEAIKTKNT
ncbi:hypothetical protein [Limnoglobus roseus]|uniref:Uncharacterized protein n=1 Tax=Limnoglobus roseus TaxID=2598579 RepID=A0A5C1AC26_9BACT|nr:hypothetical protein [Limnoglobus roseus]QEL16929.1 hypothetical protein PX52LOC_03905 [Limnoglobus roseus]